MGVGVSEGSKGGGEELGLMGWVCGVEGREGTVREERESVGRGGGREAAGKVCGVERGKSVWEKGVKSGTVGIGVWGRGGEALRERETKCRERKRRKNSG